jgi:anaphase-promoting complex subunit 3
MQLMQIIGRAYVALCQYDCPKALQLFQSVPSRHFNTGWVLCQVGRAHFEMGEYQKAEKVFSEVRSCDPCQLDGMEIYSTTLWHLGREVQLSALAQDLTNLSKESPQV